jgi:hypothetical protein
MKNRIRKKLELIKKIESEIEILNTEIMNRMQKLKEDIEIAMSMTGMGFSYEIFIYNYCKINVYQD